MGISVLGVGGVGVKVSGSRADPCASCLEALDGVPARPWRLQPTRSGKGMEFGRLAFTGRGNGLILGTSTLD